MKLTITSYSTALFSTWHLVEEWGLLFDAGDGLSAMLGSRSRKAKHVFISHADRDHVTGLLQFMQLNGSPDGPQVYYPRDCGTFPNLENFSRVFDPHIGSKPWNPVIAGDEIFIARDLVITPVRNSHVPAPPEKMKSFGFIVERIRQKLKPEFGELKGDEIGRLRKERGETALFEQVRDKLFAYSGDTPMDDLRRWDDVHTLIHEATFIDDADMDANNPKKNKHSTLNEVMEMIAQTNVKHVILSHFSTRYHEEQIREAVEKAKERFGVQIPVDLILPGQVAKHNTTITT